MSIIKKITIPSSYDGFDLIGNIFYNDAPKGVIQIIHGMSEHKERYHNFCKFLCENGYIVCICDTRGHGESTNSLFSFGYFGNKGHNALISDELSIITYLQNEYNLPITIIAHSMGTIITRVFIQKYAKLLSNVVLIGAPNYQGAALFGGVITNTLRIFKGEKGHSKLLDKLIVDVFNKDIKNPISKNQWICSNLDVVKKYDQDPLCGFSFTIFGYKTLLKLLVLMHKKKNYKTDFKSLPILICTGENDPCVGGKKGITDTINTLKYTYKNISHVSYPNMQHEILNEDNNDIVYHDILSFINK